MGKISKYLMPLGMIGVIFYFAHTILGNILWKEYNPITMDISSLTADGAPNAEFLKVLGFVYGICMVLMVAALIKKAFTEYNNMLKVGYIILMVMELISLFGYGLFPLTADKNEMSFQNIMHIVVTVAVVFTTITSCFFISFGYLKESGMERLGKITLVMSIFITSFGVFTPISMSLKLNILGLTERLAIYTIQTFIFTLSYYYTFIDNKRRKME